MREAAEETGLDVRVVRWAGQVELPGPGGVVYDVDDFACSVTGGTLQAGDDADDVRWVTAAELAELEVAPGLIDALTQWGLMPR